MRLSKRRRWPRRLALGLAVAAAVAPSAQAGSTGATSNTPSESAAKAYEEAYEATRQLVPAALPPLFSLPPGATPPPVFSPPPGAVLPPGFPTPSAPVEMSTPPRGDGVSAGSPGEPKAPESSPIPVPTGFDYRDAGIGAAIAVGAALLAALGFLALRRNRRTTGLA